MIFSAISIFAIFVSCDNDTQTDNQADFIGEWVQDSLETEIVITTPGAFTINSIDEDFEGCIKNILETYEKTWLTPLLVDGFRQIHNGAPTKYGTKIHSVGVWDKTTNELVAGEIGFRNGHLYSSLSGFRKRNHVGNIQMSALCK